MEGHVNKIQIKGSDLGKVFLLKEEKYYQYYYLIKMTATYAFKFGANAGDCGIEFAFSGKRQETTITLELFLTSALSDFRAWRKGARIASEKTSSKKFKPQ